MDGYLSLTGTAELLGESLDSIYKKQQRGQLAGVIEVPNAGVGGAGGGEGSGRCYMVPVSSLPAKFQRKYARQQEGYKEEVIDKIVSHEELSAKERDLVAFRKNILQQWHGFRNQVRKKKTQRDREFIGSLADRGIVISVRTLQYWDRALRDGGERGLLDNRGKARAGTTTIPLQAWNEFLMIYMNENRLSLAYSCDLVRLWAKDKPNIKIPSNESFRRYLSKEIDTPVLQYMRYGAKLLEDRYLPYVERVYESLDSNEIWVCDNHTFDVIVMGKDGKVYRPYLVAYMDVRSRKVVGYRVAKSANSNDSFLALREAIKAYGLPSIIYTDNGREFLVTDITGRGNRKAAAVDHHIPTLLELLNIEHWNAKVRNAKAKTIERRFLDVKNWFSKLFTTYCGGNVIERPEYLKDVLKKEDKIIEEEKFKVLVDGFITGYLNNKGSNGKGMEGKTPNVVYGECLIEKRVFVEETLNLLLMRSSKAIKVGQNGVTMRIGGGEITWENMEKLLFLQGKKVYVRYDPENLAEARIYDMEDRFVCIASQVQGINYGATAEELGVAAQKRARAKRAITEVAKTIKNGGSMDPLDIVASQASFDEFYNARVMKLEQSDFGKEQVLGTGTDGVVIDFAKMVENARKSKEVSNGNEY